MSITSLAHAGIHVIIDRSKPYSFQKEVYLLQKWLNLPLIPKSFPRLAD